MTAPTCPHDRIAAESIPYRTDSEPMRVVCRECGAFFTLKQVSRNNKRCRYHYDELGGTAYSRRVVAR